MKTLLAIVLHLSTSIVSAQVIPETPDNQIPRINQISDTKILGLVENQGEHFTLRAYLTPWQAEGAGVGGIYLVADHHVEGGYYQTFKLPVSSTTTLIESFDWTLGVTSVLNSHGNAIQVPVHKFLRIYYQAPEFTGGSDNKLITLELIYSDFGYFEGFKVIPNGF